MRPTAHLAHRPRAAESVRSCLVERAQGLVAAALVALAAALAVPSGAHAQSRAQMNEARDLFQAGLESARQGQWEAAREAFERSLAIVERASTLLNLAGAQAQTGRLVAAAETYRRFLARDDAGRYRAEAEASLRALEARIARLTIAAVGLEDDDAVRVDDRTIPHDALQAPLAVDPGRRVVSVVRDGQELTRRELALGEGESRTVAIEVAPRIVAAATPEVPALELTPEEPRDDGGDDTWVWVGVGIGAAVVVGVAVGVVLAITSSESEPLYQGNLGDGMIRF